MRDVYHKQLDSISRSLVEMTALVGMTLERATTALLKADLPIAEAVIAAGDEVDALQRALDKLTLDLFARQQPVAGDLRTLVTSLRMSTYLERMGDLAGHVAKIARMRYPATAVPSDLRATLKQMGHIGVELAGKIGKIIEGRDLDAARSLDIDDDAVDHLHRTVFAALTSSPEPYTSETVIDVILISRYYERFADHAVAVAKQLVFLIAGEEDRTADVKG
jgi:phosphate transport system protein